MSAQRTHAMKRHDTAPPIRVKICDEIGSPVSLAGATLPRFFMRDSVSGVAKVDAAASVENAALGIVAYSWSSADTSESGTFYAEFSVVLSSGKTLTVPSDTPIVVRILPDLDGV